MAGQISLKAPSGGTVSLNAADTAANFVVTMPAATANILGSTAVSASTTNTVTNKVAVNIGGTTYYLLASTSGA